MTKSDCLKGETTANMSTFPPKMRYSKKRHDEERCCTLSFPTRSYSQIRETNLNFHNEAKAPTIFDLLIHFKLTKIFWRPLSACSEQLFFVGLKLNWGQKRGEKNYNSIISFYNSIISGPRSLSNILHLLMQQSLLRSSHFCWGSLY